MCSHVFDYPQDKRENYNPDGETLTGVCRHCGAEKKAYGMRWAIKAEENFLRLPYGKPHVDFLDKTRSIW